MDGGGRVEQLTGQLHELNMQLSQLKELNSQLEAQHSTAVEEVNTRLHSETPSHKQIYKVLFSHSWQMLLLKFPSKINFKHIFLKNIF